MPKPIYFLTVQEAHRVCNFLMDQIWAKYEQFDSSEYGAVDTPAFNAEACELANLLAHVSQLCQKLSLPFNDRFMISKRDAQPIVWKKWQKLHWSVKPLNFTLRCLHRLQTILTRRFSITMDIIPCTELAVFFLSITLFQDKWNKSSEKCQHDWANLMQTHWSEVRQYPVLNAYFKSINIC